MAPAGRLAGVDVLRLASVCGIVWFHLDAPGSRVAYAGLPAVLVISIALPVMQGRRRPFFEEARRRAGRLLGPWVFWSAVYGAYEGGRSAIRGTTFGPLQRWQTLVTGTEMHLWYLPFAFGATLAALALQRLLSRLPAGLACAVGAALGGLTLVGVSLFHPARPPGVPFGQWLFGSASIPFGLAIGMACRVAPGRAGRALAGVAACCVASGVALAALGEGPTGLAYGLGVTLACWSLTWRIPPGRLVDGLAPLALGIYVLHPFVYQQSWRFFVSRPASPGVVLVVIAASGLLTWLLRRTPVRRFL